MSMVCIAPKFGRPHTYLGMLQDKSTTIQTSPHHFSVVKESIILKNVCLSIHLQVGRSSVWAVTRAILTVTSLGRSLGLESFTLTVLPF